MAEAIAPAVPSENGMSTSAAARPNRKSVTRREGVRTAPAQIQTQSSCHGKGHNGPDYGSEHCRAAIKVLQHPIEQRVAGHEKHEFPGDGAGQGSRRRIGASILICAWIRDGLKGLARTHEQGSKAAYDDNQV